MDRTRQVEMAKSFLARHHAPPVLLLPNAWDALSARLFVAAGFDAMATTSGGVAWALGYPDGEHCPGPRWLQPPHGLSGQHKCL
jgi:2-methylisocitrate lyase-like PEP mutase family enzyme